ncbi:uncharacterized protein METZ01_LOCUS490640, partial [marine metagenome]
KVKKIDQQIVSVTIRRQDFDPARNNRVTEWLRFCHYLQAEGYFPVIVPDTDHSFDTDELFPGIYVFHECAWNMGLRMALYEFCYLNFFVPSGPSWLGSGGKKVSYIAMNMLPKGSKITTIEAYNKVGHPTGENYRWAWPNQKLVYKPDTYENILAEFKYYIQENEGQ